MKQTILVTGGTGFIGSHTTVELIEAAKWMIPWMSGYFSNTASVAALSRRSTCSNAGRTPVIFSMPSRTSIFELERSSTITTL